MILFKVIIVLFALPFVEVTVYVYNTVDSSSVEHYDCILHESLFYCRRPTALIPLNRDKGPRQCHHGGIVRSFAELRQDNVSISTVLHQWKSSIEKVDLYTRYLERLTGHEEYVCHCIDPQSFGKNCEYLLPAGTTFEETFTWANSLKKSNPQYAQLYGEIICYMTLKCNSGLLCLDWRDICDGLQQCMSGLDEENCEHLEFNECDNDEYRCMNGMCIPDEYFLDGDFDCLDWSDEIQYYNDTNCPITEASAQCDDRLCPPNQYSCGDGQCVRRRFKFESDSSKDRDCQSRRDHYFICEGHYYRKMWTLPNGRCYEGLGYEDLNATSRTNDENCEYFLKCSLSNGIEKNCPCGQNSSCFLQLNSTCRKYDIEYPKGGIMAPYVLFFYFKTRTRPSSTPDSIWINGTLKCEGSVITIPANKPSYDLTLVEIEDLICSLAKKNSLLINGTSSQHLLTFNNRSFSSFYACNAPTKYISTYRIKDGFTNCRDGIDEHGIIALPASCTKMPRHRFRCSVDEPRCLSITALGNNEDNCMNKFDEIWFGTNTKLADINCNNSSRDQCTMLRQYIENSWILNTTNQIAEQSWISFRYYCDTFWNLGDKEDENIHECKDWWKCPEDQWQCDTGQCINGKWVLDGEWDCSDASDEDEPYYRFYQPRNLQIVPFATLKTKYRALAKSTPSLTICNQTTEVHCLPVNLFHTDIRPCIHRDRIGDEHIDCYGAIDERNTILHCNQPTMLGNSFRCNSSNQCFPYWYHCLSDRCTKRSDDELWCDRREKRFDCHDFSDAICFNDTCVKNGRCDRKLDCSLGEDEYMCDYNNNLKIYDAPYRNKKQFFVKNGEQKLRLIRFPADSNITKGTTSLGGFIVVPSIATRPAPNASAPIAYRCNRGVGVQMYDNSTACFCPPQYYGDQCQFHTDRITVLIHLNLSHSIYRSTSDIKIVLKLLILFLFNNETITNHVFHVRPATEIFVYSKKIIHFLYSRSSRYLQHKQQRYFNQSNITYDQPYSVRIELYERKDSGDPLFVAVWQYPIYFDYLPVFRFTKVLRLVESKPCSSNPCHSNQDCHQLINDQSKYICLCKSNFTGENCSIEDPHCINGFCAIGSICKPNYRGVLIGNELPYCICPFDRLGERCHIKYDKCASTPCLNNGSCFSTSKPDTISCLCTEQYHGKNCERRKPSVNLYFNESIPHIAAVVQYFDIDFIFLTLALSHQQVYRTLPPFVEYRYQEQTAPEVVLLKLYSSTIDAPAELYLISSHIGVSTISATVPVMETNQCAHIHSLTMVNMISYDSPIRYHSLCYNNTDLICFHDDFYLCICEENRTRVECFPYNAKLDQCSRCLGGGRCLQGDRSRSTDYLCLCPRCYSGRYCQLNSNSFVFTLDQLFFADLHSNNQKLTLRLLIIFPFLLALIALPNNLFAFVTSRRPKCSSSGVGQYLLVLSIINQLSFSILVFRLIHLGLAITGLRSHPTVDNILCKILNYLLISLTRIVYWLISFIATERVYTVVFLKGQWLKKPSIARRLIMLTIFIVFASATYELVFVRSFLFEDDNNKNMCVIEFPINTRFKWILFHQIVSITHSMLPLLINMGCTITMVCIIIRSKLNIRQPEHGIDGTEITSKVEKDDDNNHQRTKEGRHRLYILRDVLTDNKEVLTRPAITLIPSIFALFSLPSFIISFSLGCQNIEQNPMRYALIVFYFISFIPQIITFLLYVYPSSLYFNEWRLTKLGQWTTALRKPTAVQNKMVFSTRIIRTS